MVGVMQKIGYDVPSNTTTASGGKKEEYTDGGEDYAYVENLNSRLDAVALQSVQGTVMRFKIRKRPSLSMTKHWRIRYDGNVYKILTISELKEKPSQHWFKVEGKTLK